MTSSGDPLDDARRLIEQGELTEVDAVLGDLIEYSYEAAMLAGVAANRAGDLSTAIEHFSRAAEIEPGRFEATLNLGLTYRAMENDTAAETALRRALDISPDLVSAYFAVGNLLMQGGLLEDAAHRFTAVTVSQPHHVGALNNLGICYSRLGKLVDAATNFESVLEFEPRHVGALANLGAIRSEQGRSEEAINLLKRVLTLEPEQVEATNNLGVALMDKGRYGEAAELLRSLTENNIAGAEAFSNLGNALAKLGETARADEAYQQAFLLKPDPGIRVKRAMLLPIVSASTEVMDAARSEFERRVDALIADPPQLDDPFSEVGVTTFALSYQNYLNRTLMEKVARMYRAICPALTYTAERLGKIGQGNDLPVRIGFVSRFFQNHSVGRCFHGIPRFHGRDDIEITVFTFTTEADPLWRQIEKDVDKTVVLPAHFGSARNQIASEEIDILVYTDIGMDPLTYFLTFCRLAPLQCVLSGHPDSVGVDTIDAYISCDMQEPPDAEEHYLAPLVRLPGSPTYYERPKLPEPMKPRGAFGLPNDAPIYFCGQTLIKIHPDMDALFRGILELDPDGELVFPEGYTPELADLLSNRFRETLGSLAARVKFLPAMSHTDYMNVLAFSNVALDTRPFGGGNTSWQAIAVGTPMVTWPGHYLRGRYTQALYRLIGVEDAIANSAEDYIARAVKFATARAFTVEFNDNVRDRADRIFCDRRHVDALYSYLLDRFSSVL